MIARRKTITKKGRMWLFGLGVLAIATAVLVSVLVFASSSDVLFTATPYADLVRFQADGVATLQVKVFDLSGKKVWDSSVVSGDTIDWDRNNDFGERLAYGAYIYSAQGWNVSGALALKNKGKLALMPGDKVQLQAAPTVVSSDGQESAPPVSDASLTLKPMSVNVDHSTESWAFGQIGIGTTNPTEPLHIYKNANAYLTNRIENPNSGNFAEASISLWNDMGYAAFELFSSNWVNAEIRNKALFTTKNTVAGLAFATLGTYPIEFYTGGVGAANKRMIITSQGNVGIGTTIPAATLEVHGSATNLLALYDPATPTDPKFRVEKTGTVYADGAYYGARYNTGSADVAERINTSEWVEPGNVVEIDPEHPGFFRKSSTPYSTKVAGIISTCPGVILGNATSEEATDDWKDNRPMLAVTGRVPCKVSTENGPIEIGDLLVSSSTPGIAMKGKPGRTMGAVVGKAMEPLKGSRGSIMVQVMLR